MARVAKAATRAKQVTHEEKPNYGVNPLLK